MVRLRDRVGSDTVIIGNGDVQSHDEMVARHERYGVDGVMIGRAARRNPFVFNPTFKAMKLRSATQRCKLLTEHVRLCREHYGDKEGTMVIKRFIKSYLVHFKGSPELRAQLIKTETLTENRRTVTRLSVLEVALGPGVWGNLFGEHVVEMAQ